jgi:hypothetical protein
MSIDRGGHMTERIRTAAHHWVARVVVEGDDRGDVPGWVLITVMTAGLVTALWIVADDQLRAIFTDALGRVNGP